MEKIAQNFSEDKASELNASFTDDEVLAEYEANKKNYNYADIRYY